MVRDDNGKVNTWKSKSRIEYGTHDDAKHLKESVTDNMPTYGSHTQNGLNVLISMVTISLELQKL